MGFMDDLKKLTKPYTEDDDDEYEIPEDDAEEIIEDDEDFEVGPEDSKE